MKRSEFPSSYRHQLALNRPFLVTNLFEETGAKISYPLLGIFAHNSGFMPFTNLIYHFTELTILEEFTDEKVYLS